MEDLIAVAALVVGVIGVSGLARAIRVPAPIVLVAAGVVVSVVPGAPTVEPDPELVLVVLLPPLLYAAALRSSLTAVRESWRVIASLAVGLVIATTVAVGLGLHAVVGSVSLAAAMAPSSRERAMWRL